MSEKVLTLRLKRKWFDMFLTGEKTEEYRDHTDYWEKRLVEETTPKFKTIFKPFTVLHAINGYGKDRPYFKAKIDYMKLSHAFGPGSTFIDEDGDECHKYCYIIGIEKPYEIGNTDPIKQMITP